MGSGAIEISTCNEYFKVHSFLCASCTYKLHADSGDLRIYFFIKVSRAQGIILSLVHSKGSILQAKENKGSPLHCINSVNSHSITILGGKV